MQSSTLAVLNSQAFACLCAFEVKEAFSSLQKAITSSIETQKEAVKNLTQKVKQSQNALEEENKVIEKLIAAEKQLALSRGNLLFELSKKIKLMK